MTFLNIVPAIPNTCIHFKYMQVQSLNRGFLWDNFFSRYSFFGFLGNVFRNNFVLEKWAGKQGWLFCHLWVDSYPATVASLIATLAFYSAGPQL